jgi:hypothetical protein
LPESGDFREEGCYPDGMTALTETRSATPADFVPYSERRPYVVADHLWELRGPSSGVVRLPILLDWSGTPEKNLDQPGVLASVYETVLNEASSVEELNTWLDRPTLLRLWPEMWLPAKVRRLWEERFPLLARVRACSERRQGVA